ncbi:unnamed protein product, partial [Closterium sp. NIES-54]
APSISICSRFIASGRFTSSAKAHSVLTAAVSVPATSRSCSSEVISTSSTTKPDPAAAAAPAATAAATGHRRLHCHSFGFSAALAAAVAVSAASAEHLESLFPDLPGSQEVRTWKHLPLPRASVHPPYPSPPSHSPPPPPPPQPPPLAPLSRVSPPPPSASSGDRPARRERIFEASAQVRGTCLSARLSTCRTNPTLPRGRRS